MSQPSNATTSDGQENPSSPPNASSSVVAVDNDEPSTPPVDNQ